MPKYEDYRLRAMAEQDRDMALEWRNSEKIRPFMYADHRIQKEEHDRWFSNALQKPNGKFLILDYHDQPIGFASFPNIDFKNGKCLWTYYLGTAPVPMGAGAALEFFALDFIFGEVGLRKLCCEAFAFNASVIKQHKKFGFQQEGYYVRHIAKNGKFEDVVALALFKEDWKRNREQLGLRCFRDLRNTTS
jgi:UDP-4-amino-4,6-dideoxy-N-acetyl-beta-L-altrosamine N-acetyltransferase